MLQSACMAKLTSVVYNVYVKWGPLAWASEILAIAASLSAIRSIPVVILMIVSGSFGALNLILLQTYKLCHPHNIIHNKL